MFSAEKVDITDSSSNNAAKDDAAVSSVADQLASTKLSADEENEDIDLLSFPPTPTEDCPVCMVPLPIESLDYKYWICCGRNICFACDIEQGKALYVRNTRRKKEELSPLEQVCAFCRASAASNFV